MDSWRKGAHTEHLMWRVGLATFIFRIVSLYLVLTGGTLSCTSKEIHPLTKYQKVVLERLCHQIPPPPSSICSTDACRMELVSLNLM